MKSPVDVALRRGINVGGNNSIRSWNTTGKLLQLMEGMYRAPR
jgi:uncharacterized protein (DUF1697 family)